MITTPGRVKAILAFVICVLSSVFGLALGHRGTQPPIAPKRVAGAMVQGSDEKVIKVYRHPRSPVEMSNLTVKGVRITPDAEFSASGVAVVGGQGDWLQDLSLKLKNVSDREITTISLSILFLETIDVGRAFGYDKRLGQGLSAPAAEEGRQPFALEPGQSVKVSLSGDDLESIREGLVGKGFQLHDLNKVHVQVTYILFSDGVQWNGGILYRPNPDAPNGWERIGEAPLTSTPSQ